MLERLHAITENIIESYDSIGGINHIGGCNLPSRESMATILSDIESIIFPGYKFEEPVSRGNLEYFIGRKVIRVAGSLIDETQKCIRYKNRIEDIEMDEHELRFTSEEKVLNLMDQLPYLREIIRQDVDAAFQGDPAAKYPEEVVLSYPGVEAIIIHRVANAMWKAGVPLLPRMMSEHIHGKTGIDIHPGATIGPGFFIDHGTGVVIGETCIIGRGVKVYQGVTLGALSVRKNEADTKRHPTIEDNVTIYAGATILGGDTVIGKGSIVGGNVWLVNSVPANSRIYNRPSEYIHRQAKEQIKDYQI